MLCSELAVASYLNPKSDSSGRAIDQAAVFIWMRLWVELAYLAQTTNRPGLMTSSGAGLFMASLEPMFGEGVDVMKLLTQAGCLKPNSQSPIADGQEEGWMCERFGRMNAHLAQNFVSREVKGAAASALERNKYRLAAEANQQADLLPREIFKKRSGETMTPQEVQRCMVLIKNVDHQLANRGRKPGEYTEGLIADASAASERYSPESLREFYIWMGTHREHPALPKTTEQVLAKFEEVFSMKS